MRSDLSRKVKMLGVLCAAGLLAATSPGSSPVADAAMRGDADAVRALIRQGEDVNTPQGDGMTALHWAAENGDVEIAKLLIYAGAHPEAATRNGAYTPLHIASELGHASVIQVLLAGGANPDAKTSTEVRPLHFAAASGSADAVAALLHAGADVNAVEAAAGQTPLIFAAAGNRADAIAALLAAGANPALTTKIVDVVARVEEDNILRERRNRVKALEWGRELPGSGYADTRAQTQDQAKKVEARPTGLPDAERKALGFHDLMSYKGGLTALHHAAREGHIEAALALLAQGADIDQTSADHSTALLTATINGHFDLAMRLLEHGADPNIASVAGAAPLYTTINLQWGSTSWYPQPTAHRQQRTSYLELMEALLNAGADPNARLEMELWYSEYQGDRLNVSQWGATPFWRAAYGTDVKAMQLLIAYGADPTIPTKKKPERQREGAADDAYPEPPVPTGGPSTYPIHAATGAGYGLGFAGNAHRHVPLGWMPALKYLVEELGANVNQRDHQGYTALHNAASRGDNEMILYLVAKGADVRVVSREGQTTADMANGPYQRISPFPETVALLESLGAKNNHNCVSC